MLGFLGRISTIYYELNSHEKRLPWQGTGDEAIMRKKVFCCCELSWLCSQIFVWWNAHPQHLRMWLYLEMGPLKRWLNSNEATRVGPNPYDCPPCKRGNLDALGDTRAVHTEERAYEDSVRRWPSMSQGERPLEEPNLPRRWSWTSGLEHLASRTVRRKISVV